MGSDIKVEKGWIFLTTASGSAAFICAANVTGVVQKAGNTSIYFAGSCEEVRESASDVRLALDAWYSRDKAATT